MSTHVSDLRKLSNIISGAVDRIEAILKAQNLSFPSLDTPFSQESEVAREIPEVFNATNIITSAAAQLAAIARSPAMTMLDVTLKACQGSFVCQVLTNQMSIIRLFSQPL